MAVTSLWSYKNTVFKCIQYVMNPEKTDSSNWKDFHLKMDGKGEFTVDERDEKVFLVTGIGGVNVDSPETAAWYFNETKEMYHKTKGRQCYHGYQSFAADEVDPEEAHQIGIELAKSIWGDRFQVVVATHVNTGHVHNHFVINSVSIADGYKFYNSPEDYDLMRRTSDEICIEHGLSIVEEPKEVGSKNWLRNKAAAQPYTREKICRDIDAAVVDSVSLDDVYRYLEELGYKLKIGDQYKYPAISPPDAYDKNGKRRFYRFCNLNRFDGYDIEELSQRLRDPEYDRQVLKREYIRYQLREKNQNKQRRIYKVKLRCIPIYRRFRGYSVNGKKVHSYFFYRYYKYKNELEKAVNNRLSSSGAASYKDLQMISSATIFMLRHDIQSINDVSAIKLQLHKDIAELNLDKQDPDRALKLNGKKEQLEVCDYILKHNKRIIDHNSDKTIETSKER